MTTIEQLCLPQPSPRLITAGEKSDTFTDRLGLLLKRHLEGVHMKDDPAAEVDDSDSPDWLVREMVRRAKDGDTDAALELMQVAMCELLARSINPHISDYLADCLMRAHKALSNRDGRPSEVLVNAFNLTRQKRRPNAAKTQERDWNVAVWVQMAQDECRLSATAAKNAAGELFGVENINRVLRDAGGVVEYHAENCRKHFLDIGKPLPPRR